MKRNKKRGKSRMSIASVGKLDYYIKKNETGPLSTYYTKVGSRWFKYLSINGKNIKLKVQNKKK